MKTLCSVCRKNPSKAKGKCMPCYQQEYRTKKNASQPVADLRTQLTRDALANFFPEILEAKIRIQLYFRSANCSQRQLGETLGLSRSTVMEWPTKPTAFPGRKHAELILLLIDENGRLKS